MANEPCWVTPGGVIRINQLAVTRTGEPHQLLNADLLEGACARPRNHWSYDGVEDVVVLGCVLLLGIARNHAFIQGNKRTAFTAMIGFFGANGYVANFDDSAATADYIIAAIEKRVTDHDFIEAVRPCIAPGHLGRR